MLRLRLLIVALLTIVFSVNAAFAAQSDARLKNAYRFERAHWMYVHLEGKPADIGFQHGYLLAPEIADAFHGDPVQGHTAHQARLAVLPRHRGKTFIWPHIEPEYREELQGIADGLKAKGVEMDLWDVVALNAMEEVPDYYLPALNRQQKVANAPRLVAPGNCSAFVATGSMTKDHARSSRITTGRASSPARAGESSSTSCPTHGYRMLMDGFPGIIVSDDDFGINSAGLMVTETTITGFVASTPAASPSSCAPARRCSTPDSIDKYVEIMLQGNNGGYANDWLLADNRSGEIARFELGLKIHRVWRTRNGYFVGANFPSDPELTRKETDFNTNDAGSSINARHKRWEQLMKEYKGKIDIAMAERFLSDHFDSFQNKEEADERTLCGHADTSSRGVPEWEWGPYYPGGAVGNQAADASMATRMALRARDGRGCGGDFQVEPFLKAHPEYEWMRPAMIDMPGNPWVEFTVSDREK